MASLHRLEGSRYAKENSPFTNLYQNLKDQWETLNGYLQQCHKFGRYVFMMHFRMGRISKQDTMKLLEDIKAHSNALRVISEKLKNRDTSEAFLKGTNLGKSGTKKMHLNIFRANYSR